MASEASRKKAEAVWLKAVRRCFADPLLKQEIVGPEEIADALDEALAEGARRRAEQDDVLAGVIAKTRAAALKEGAERERWECHRAATVNILSSSPSVWNEAARVIADRIAARGPMRGPEEE